MVAMFTDLCESMEVTSATWPGWSRLWTIRVGESPLKFTLMPSSLLTMMRPPPREEACTSSSRPPAVDSCRMAVFGCASFNSILSKVNASPCSTASAKLSGMWMSSGFMPSRPATSARSVPWPVPVAANEPESVIFAVAGCPPSSRRAISPIRTAPAVWELEGPTMTGPRISKMFMEAPFSIKSKCSRMTGMHSAMDK